MATKAKKTAKTTKAKGAAPRKKAPPKPTPITSPIVLSVAKVLRSRRKNLPLHAALAVIYQMAREAKDNDAVMAYLDRAYQQVKDGGGSEGGANAEPFPPADDPGQ